MMANVLWRLSCCPSYEPVEAAVKTTQMVTPADRRARTEKSAVNPTSGFTDNMWCRARDTITGKVIVTEAHRD